MDNDHDYLIKIIVIGDTNVGKTNIITRLTKNIFIESSNATVSCECSSKMVLIENKRIKAQVWDTAGQERYRSITKSYFTHSKGIVVVFDLNNYETLQNVNSWIEDAKSILGEYIPMIIIGNKSDIDDKDAKKIEEFELISLSKKYSN